MSANSVFTCASLSLPLFCDGCEKSHVESYIHTLAWAIQTRDSHTPIEIPSKSKTGITALPLGYLSCEYISAKQRRIREREKSPLLIDRAGQYSPLRPDPSGLTSIRIRVPAGGRGKTKWTKRERERTTHFIAYSAALWGLQLPRGSFYIYDERRGFRRGLCAFFQSPRRERKREKLVSQVSAEFVWNTRVYFPHTWKSKDVINFK